MIAFRIVIVDDDPDDRELLRTAFEEEGAEPVFAFSSAEDLLTHLHDVESDEELPLLIITDVNMPVMTGLELLGRLKLTPRFSQIPIVVWSTSNNTQEMTRALRLGATGYFVKPLRLSDYPALTERMMQHAAVQ